MIITNYPFFQFNFYQHELNSKYGTKKRLAFLAFASIGIRVLKITGDCTWIATKLNAKRRYFVFNLFFFLLRPNWSTNQ